MKKISKIPVVFFNASVVIAGLKSQSGGSAKLLNWVKNQKIIGIISEIVFHEVLHHSDKIKLSKKTAQDMVDALFKIVPAPNKSVTDNYISKVIDIGDAHILASCQETNVDFLVTLDKKHLLILQQKIKEFRILSPKELIEKLA